MARKSLSTLLLFILLSLVPGLIGIARAQGGFDPAVQTPALLYEEARTVYLGNLARRHNGVPPLRWNLQLTHAGRWFSWDSIVNRQDYCGHQDTLGRWPGERALYFGYLGGAGAENAFCGYGITPEVAIQGWMNSPGHRANLLSPDHREIGLGYYQRNSDGKRYVTQGFGSDSAYAPVIIENEALSTTNPNVNLYVYNRTTGGGFAGSGPGTSTQMMVSNNPYFCGASWEPYNANKAWTLAGGEGWRNVYVKTRDQFNRTLTASDSIYLGGTVPLNELGAAQMSTTQSQVTLYNLNGGGFPQVQFSLGWMADDTSDSFKKWWGNGERVNDPAAWGGTAYRLYPGDGESFAWADDWRFPIKDVPMVAYFRLKVNNNTSGSEVARISVDGGGTSYGPISLKGTDFATPNQYQEFAINFVNNNNPNDEWLTFNFWRSGNADVYVDAVTIFTAPQAVTSPLTWSVPGGNYRGQGVWVRYTNGSQFSGLSEAGAPLLQDFTISGNAGVGGATLSYTDGSPKTVKADASGNYSFTVSCGWSGTVTPSRTGFTFDPASRTYVGVSNDHTGQNYTASWVGGVRVESNRNVVAVGRPHVGAEVASYDGFSSGSLSAYVPMLFRKAYGSYNSALYVQNVHASNDAHVTVRYYDSDGILQCTKTDTISPLSSKGYWLPTETCNTGSLVDGWVGGAVITSDQPIVAVGRPHVGGEVMTYNGFTAGSLASYIPMLFKNAWGSYNSAFYIQNVSDTTEASITIKYYDSDGLLKCTKADSIKPLASRGYWVPTVTCDTGELPDGWVGGVVVASDQPVVGVGRPHVGSQVTTYNGFTDGGSSSYVPMLFKAAFGGSYNAAFYLQNTNDTATASVTIKYYSNSGTLDCTKTDTIAPLASKGYWLPGVTCDSGSLQPGWVGGVVVTSDQPIVGVGRPHVGEQVTTYNGFTEGGLNSYLPMLFKDAFGGSYDSAFYVQNTENTTATVTIKLYDTNGSLACTRTDTVAALSTLGYWLPSIACNP